MTYLQRVVNYNPFELIVELLIIAVVVGWVMRFLRGTRGARLVKGAGLLLATVYVVILMLPSELGWHRIKFLYGNFLLFTFVAVVVAFQPEIRRAFIQLGQASLFRGSSQVVTTMIDALTESCAYLSRNKIGAIVAIERTVGLAALSETGIELEAQLTASLLNTIFYPGTALHDMGVIVREGRIAAAGCQFPLAESEEVDPSLGSRHRAALGLTKESDAAVIVVSEETGQISLALEGQLYVGLELENLRGMLLSLLAPAKVVRKFRKDSRANEGSA